MGRPSKWTPELAREFLGLIEEGSFVSSACAQVGISRTTWANWQTRAKAGEEPFSSFLDAVRACEAGAERAVSLTIYDRAVYKQDTKAAAWWLQHRYPSRWRGKPHAEESVDPPGALLDPETVEALREVADLVQAIGPERLAALAQVEPEQLDALLDARARAASPLEAPRVSG